MLNILGGSLMGLGYLRHAGPVEDVRVAGFLVLGLVSSVLLLTLFPGLLLALTARLLPSARVLGWLSTILWTLFQGALFLDTRIYGLFRYHFNGMVWNVLVTPGASDSVEVELTPVVILALVFILILVGERILWVLLWKREELRSPGRPPRWFTRPLFLWCAVLLPLVLVEKGTFAWADLHRDARVTSQARLLPLYQRLTVKRLARRHFGFDSGARPRIAISAEGLRLNYPRKMPQVDPGGPRPNLLILVVDSLRADALRPERMPCLFTWAESARRFGDHVSGGNGTRFGIFSLLYALHGTYWHPVYAEHRSPVFLDVLLAEGYETAVFSSTSMSFPEFRSTAWVRMGDKVHDAMAGEKKWMRDETLSLELIEWLGERAGEEGPFFAFCLFDSPHMPYSFPPDRTSSRLWREEIDYLELSGEADEATRFNVTNRYWSAVSWADHLLGRILSAVEELNLSGDTWVLVTSDHGEDLFERGYGGHTSNFAPEQVRVPFLLRGPGIEPGVEKGPTHHADLAPTFLEMMGADPALRGDWCLGGNLMEPDPERRRVITTWNELALWTPNGIVLIPRDIYRGGVEYYDYDWNVVPGVEPWMEAENARIGTVALECQRFLR
jgi:membrane-anchored protein YejM (alkaline phosphatase superfamily)